MALQITHHRVDLLTCHRALEDERVGGGDLFPLGEALEVGEQRGDITTFFSSGERLLLEARDARLLPLGRQRLGSVH
uniref:hypothetical protein n=1 Tax=Mycolicibacterium poriferae TaxID=39694 RepID=UPI0024B95121